MIRTTKVVGKHSQKLTAPSLIYQGLSRLLIKALPIYPSTGRYNLTICNERKILWYRVAKVGTRTIFDIFDQAKLKLDAEHPFFCHYPSCLYRDYFKFAFVRNPWDRLVSCWKNKVVDQNYFSFDKETLEKMQDFSNFVDYVKSKDLENCDQHLRMQSKLIDLNNVDFIGRFENFNEDVQKVASVIGIEYHKTQKNASKHKSSYTDYYDDHLRDVVAEMYKKDINIFQYEYGS